MDNTKLQFLPFHALNQFMRPDFRLEVVRSALTALPGLPAPFQAQLERQTKKSVQVPGFRNSGKAPLAVRIKPTAEAFEKSADMTAVVLSAWSAAHPELRQQVNDLLTGRGWEVMLPDADRTRLPGFRTVWPKGEDFDVLNQAFVEKYPEAQVSSDEVSLMVVWLSLSLPYQTDDDDEGAPEAGDEPETDAAPGA